MSRSHQPDPEFEAHLEWQLRSALRREDRFSEPTRPHNGGKMKAAALIMVSALLGAGGVVAKDEMQEVKAGRLLELNALLDIELARVELDMTQSRLKEVENLFQEDLIVEEVLLAARASVQEAEQRLAALQLDLEEVQASGKEPNNLISAPLVSRRDFVTDRLVLEESVAVARVRLAESALARIQDLREADLVSRVEVDLRALALREAESQRDRILRRMDVRKRFLDEGLEGEDAERIMEILEFEIRIQVAEQALIESRARGVRITEQYEAGLIPISEARQWRNENVQLELEVQLLQRKLAALRALSGGGE